MFMTGFLSFVGYLKCDVFLTYHLIIKEREKIDGLLE